MSKVKIYQVRDESDNFVIKNKRLPDCPHRGIIVGASGSGKTSFLVSLYAHPDNLGKVFKGENIFIISGSLKEDIKLQKMIKFMEIPPENVHNRFSEEWLQTVYDMIKEDFNEAVEEKKKPEQTLIILDDVSFSGSLKDKESGIVSELACNSRKVCCSFVCTAQKYSQISTCVRNNANFGAFWNTTLKELDLIQLDWDYGTDKRNFIKKFREATKDKHSTFIVRKDKPRDEWYTSDFNNTIEIN